jgi:hypothetical protein
MRFIRGKLWSQLLQYLYIVFRHSRELLQFPIIVYLGIFRRAVGRVDDITTVGDVGPSNLPLFGFLLLVGEAFLVTFLGKPRIISRRSRMSLTDAYILLGKGIVGRMEK